MYLSDKMIDTLDYVRRDPPKPRLLRQDTLRALLNRNLVEVKDGRVYLKPTGRELLRRLGYE